MAPLWLIPLDHALPAIQAFLAAGVNGPLDERAAARRLEQFVRTAEVLVEFAVRVGRQPCAN
ncbi:MAG TPA: hypothetical protein VNI61_05755 [Gemmatimonadales bacterium]|nr:hypothetical protein [Gemmatimonadales bacterium]